MTLSVLFGGLGAAGGTFALRSGHLDTLSVAVPETRNDGLSAGALRPFAVSPASSTSATPSSSAPATTTTPSTSAKPAPPPTEESKEDTPTSSSAKPSPKPRSSPTLAGQVISLVNDERSKAGCDPVTEESHLDKAAQGHSDDMSNRDYFSHDTPEGESFADRITAAGYSKPGAENIAKGATSADQVMQMWMNSSGHRKNILNCSLTKLGVGVATDGWYWTQDFGY